MRTTLLSLLLVACVHGTDAPVGTHSGPTGTTPTGDDDDTTAACASVDADGDGSNACDDCDDGDPAVFPGAPERCDEKDDDCDGSPLPDEGPACEQCDAQGFWLPTRELTGDALVAELHDLEAGHVCNSYSQATDYMFLDLDNVDGIVTCVYTGRTTPVSGTKPDPNVMNTEHTWPQSEGADQVPAKCDLNHLYPTDTDANSARGNLPFGVVTGTPDWQDGGSRRGHDAHGVEVFEPRDQHKGNVGRSMLYFAMQYGYPVSADDLALWQQWSAADPPDEAEVQRTLTIADRQGAGNAYVLCPWLVDAL